MLAAALVTGAVLAGCGDDEAARTTSTTAPRIDVSASVPTTTVAPRPPGTLPDPCSLLAASDVNSVIGGPSAATAGLSSESPPFRSCTWGDLTAPAGLVSVVVSTAGVDGTLDYGATLAEASGDDQGAPAPVGTDGHLLGRAVLAGGGNAGATVWFRHGDVTVLVAWARTSAVDPDRLQGLARAADARVG